MNDTIILSLLKDANINNDAKFDDLTNEYGLDEVRNKCIDKNLLTK